MSYAQTAPLPGSADPGRFEERFKIEENKQDEEIIQPEKLDISPVIPEAQKGFILQGIKLERENAFSKDAFDLVIAEYTGRTADLNVLNHLAARITQIYREEGYFLSRAIVPEQEIENGIVTIRIIEGHVRKVIVDDPEHLLNRDPFNIFAATTKSIEMLAPLHGPTLERYILLLNDTDGVSVRSILKAPTKEALPGEIDIVLRVEKRSPSYMLSHNNYGSRFVGPHQLSVSRSQGAILSRFDSLNIEATTALPLSEVQFGAFSYSLPLTANGLKAELSASYSHSRPGLDLRALEVEGDNTNFETGLSYPLIRSRRENLNIGGAFSVLNSATEFLDEELIDDKVRTISLSADYNKQDNWSGFNTLSASLNHGLDIMGATKTGSEGLSRAEGRSDFFAARLEATRQQNITDGYQVFASVKGQYAPHPLLSSQEFGYGGIDYGRAYDPSDITGDRGIAAALEARYAGLDPIEPVDLQLVPFAFYDIGKVWNLDQDAKPESGASAGLGIHYSIGNHFSGSVQAAWPLTRSVGEPVMNGSDGPRILFGINARF